jgi:uncharacterized membrane protein
MWSEFVRIVSVRKLDAVVHSAPFLVVSIVMHNHLIYYVYIRATEADVLCMYCLPSLSRQLTVATQMAALA